MSGQRQSKRALIVDDKEENLYLLRALLVGHGYKAQLAHHGAEALELARGEPPDLIISDILMPVMDGFTLCRHWVADPRLRHIPFVFYTATYTDPKNEQLALSLGAARFLIKPVEPDAFLSIVAEVLEDHGRHQLEAPAQPIAPETEYLRQYSQALVHKLERKLAQLQSANRRLADREEALHEASRRKDEFLALLGHELRNPLAPIKTASELLNDLEPGDPRGESARETIERQVTHLAHIVDGLLDMSRITRGKLEIEREPTDWAQVVRSTVDDVRRSFEERQIRFELKTPPGELWVDGDSTRLTQVLSNLLDNARKFTGPGGRVEVELEREEHGWGRLRVRDTGLGMTAETLAGLFQPLAGSTPGRAPTRAGFGLGLSLVKAIVELHGGEVRAASAGPGLGAEFVIRMPLAAAPPSSRLPAERPARAEGAQVLIIEDNHDAAACLRTMLELAGCQVQVAYDGRSGLDIARHRVPETVLCDIGLPGELDGYSVARALRSEPTFSSTQLIALTGYGQADDKRRAREAGFDSHFTKPVARRDLLKVVARPRRQATGGG